MPACWPRPVTAGGVGAAGLLAAAPGARGPASAAASRRLMRNCASAWRMRADGGGDVGVGRHGIGHQPIEFGRAEAAPPGPGRAIGASAAASLAASRSGRPMPEEVAGGVSQAQPPSSSATASSAVRRRRCGMLCRLAARGGDLGPACGRNLAHGVHQRSGEGGIEGRPALRPGRHARGAARRRQRARARITASTSALAARMAASAPA